MDEDTRDLIVGLCTRIGMIMEDTSVAKLTLRAKDQLTWQRTLDYISAAVALANLLMRAAQALNACEITARPTRPSEAVADNLYDRESPEAASFT